MNNEHIGKSLGRYHILEQLGEGGMAIVYKAFDTHLETDVAVKVIRTENFTPAVLTRALKRFEREAKALARLTHPNIVKVTDYGECQNIPYLVMPFLSGGNLKERIKQTGAIPWQEAVRLIIPVAEALEYAHDHGVIHRDVKPSNILLAEKDWPMLTDFGVAKVIEEEATLDLTGTASAVGTPEYMAPEQSTSKLVDGRADIYSLGIVLYEMITGRKPYTADTPLAVLIMQARDPLPRPTQFAPGLPEAVEKVLIKALAKKPEDRYQNMGEFAGAMEQLGQKQQVPASVVKPIILTALTASPAPVSPPKRPTSSQGASQLKNWIWGLISIFLIIIGVVLIYCSFTKWSGKAGILVAPSTLTPSVLAPNNLPTTKATNAPTKVEIPTQTPLITSTATSLTSRFSGLSVISPENAARVSQLDQLKGDDMDISPDGNTLATVSDGTIYLWRIADGTLIKTLQNSSVSGVVYSPKENILASVGASVKLWQISDWTLLKEFIGRSLIFSPDGNILAIGLEDGTTELWRFSDWMRIETLPTNSSPSAFSPDGSILASVTKDQNVDLWRVSDGTLLRTLKVHLAWVESVNFSPVDNIIAVGGYDLKDGIIQIRRVNDGVLLNTLQDHNGAAVLCLAYSPNGTIIASGINSYMSPIHLWRVANGQLLTRLQGPYEITWSVDFSSDGRLLVTRSNDSSINQTQKTIRLWGVG